VNEDHGAAGWHGMRLAHPPLARLRAPGAAMPRRAAPTCAASRRTSSAITPGWTQRRGPGSLRGASGARFTARGERHGSPPAWPSAPAASAHSNWPRWLAQAGGHYADRLTSTPER